MARVFTIFILSLFYGSQVYGQLKWQNADSLFQPLPSSVHVYKTTDSLEGKPNIAYYLEADLKDKKLDFTADTTYQRRLTPSKFYEKNNNPLLVVNCTFFSFATNQNLNVVIKDGKQLGYNIHTVPGKGKDTLMYWHPFRSAIGINKKREADIAWLYTDSASKFPHPGQEPFLTVKDSVSTFRIKKNYTQVINGREVMITNNMPDWKMTTAVGGGPVLLQNGDIKITNNEEMMFTGKAIEDKHPRTAMGYTKNNKLIILVIEGRNPGKAEGATLTQEAQIFKDLGCWEALNLDGGGSTCMLVNGKETIKVSDATGQRPVPAVFIIKQK
jgi:exopolysaccharide biosynthesis protein